MGGGRLREWKANEHGDASEFIHDACRRALPGVVGALVVLAELADRDDQLVSWVGAGPLEDLISHDGHGAAVLDEVERSARQNAAFRAALGHVWLTAEASKAVQSRLAIFGTRVVGAG